MAVASPAPVPQKLDHRHQPAPGQQHLDRLGMTLASDHLLPLFKEASQVQVSYCGTDVVRLLSVAANEERRAATHSSVTVVLLKSNLDVRPVSAHTMVAIATNMHVVSSLTCRSAAGPRGSDTDATLDGEQAQASTRSSWHHQLASTAQILMLSQKDSHARRYKDYLRLQTASSVWRSETPLLQLRCLRPTSVMKPTNSD